jgi:hypothetical protein
MSGSKLMGTFRLGFNWPVKDPFIFCVHHKDDYPEGNASQGPSSTQLGGRHLGSDFQHPSGWSMYHGKDVPGFPVHPHRGFETVTVVLEGFVDHSDSGGAAGRYGGGDVQWMTAGSGMQHAEMFPMIHQDRGNPLELFQIWLNLPAKDKFVTPNYKMLWSEAIPIVPFEDEQGLKTSVRLISGTFNQVESLEPTPDSWASVKDHHVSVWIAEMEPGATIELPAVSKTLNRMLYFYVGKELWIEGSLLESYHGAELTGGESVLLKNGDLAGKFLLLEAEPIGEPVVQYGPFVMNTREEIMTASSDYQKTSFGGWPWDRPDPVHKREQGRFARYADGTIQTP